MSKELDFESALAQLEQIVRELERGDLPLEKSLELFEQGVRLSRECQERLSEAERRIEILLQDANGRIFTSDLGARGLNESGTGEEDGRDADEDDIPF